MLVSSPIFCAMTDGVEESGKAQSRVPDEIQELVNSAGQSASLPHFYFNGMIVAQGSADVTLILQLNNRPVAALNCSFTTAKTLAIALGNGIKHLEEIAGREIMTVDDIVQLSTKVKAE